MKATISVMKQPAGFFLTAISKRATIENPIDAAVNMDTTFLAYWSL